MMTKFIRQQWRMWIETMRAVRSVSRVDNSFASNGECGLKLVDLAVLAVLVKIHSPAMANVD